MTAHLSVQQWRLIYLLACGLSTAQIAVSLGLTYAAAVRRIDCLYRALGVQSRYQLMAMAFACGWVDAGLVAEALELDAAQVRRAEDEIRGKCLE